MDTLNDVMTDLLIDQSDRIDEISSFALKGRNFILEAQKSEKIVLDGVEEQHHASKN